MIAVGIGEGESADHSFSASLNALRNTMSDTRERMVEISNDMRWVKEQSSGFDRELQMVWASIDDIKQRIAHIETQQTGLRSALSTAASIGSAMISVGVALYVGLGLR